MSGMITNILPKALVPNHPRQPELIDLFLAGIRGNVQQSQVLQFFDALTEISNDWLKTEVLKGKEKDKDFYDAEDYRKRRKGSDARTDRKGIALHWTAGPYMDRSAKVLTTSDRSVSTHFLIDLEGEIVQLYPLNVATWHGADNWYRCGVDLQIQGGLEKDKSGKLVDWAGRPARGPIVQLDEDLFYRDGLHREYLSGFTCRMLVSLIVLGRYLAVLHDWKDPEQVIRAHHEFTRRKYDVGHAPLMWIAQLLTNGPTQTIDRKTDLRSVGWLMTFDECQEAMLTDYLTLAKNAKWDWDGGRPQ